MTISVLSPEREQKLVEAMIKAVHAVNAGGEPDQEIAKSASAYGFGPAFAERMVEAFNASKTLKHLKTASVEERADTILLATKDGVLRSMYGVQTKAASAVGDDPSKVNFNRPTGMERAFEKAASVLTGEPTSSFQAWQPDTILRETRGVLKDIDLAREDARAQIFQAKQKIASILSKFSSDMREPGHEPFELIEQRLSSVYGKKLGKQAMDIAWHALGQGVQKLEKRAETYAQLGPSYSKGYRLMAEVLEEIGLAAEFDADLRAFEKKAGLVEKYLTGRVDRFVKKAAKDPQFGVKIDLADPQQKAEYEALNQQLMALGFKPWSEAASMQHPPPSAEQAEFGTYKGYVSRMEQEAAERAQREAARATREAERGTRETERATRERAEQARRLQRETAQEARQAEREERERRKFEVWEQEQIPRVPTEGEIAQTQLESAKPLIEGLSSIGGAISNIPSIFVSDKEPEISSLIDPSHEAALREIRIKSMVNDMLINDPILSAYAPVDVVRVFNQVANLMPSLADKPLAMKALIARVLQQGGHIDPAELVNMVKAETAARSLG